MKKIFSLIVLLVCIISGCSCDKEEPVKTSIFSSYIIGYLNKEGTTYTLVEPFGTYIGFVGYSEKKVTELQDKLNEEVFKYHSLLDRNYYYKDDKGNIINNIKVINDNYGSGVAVEVNKIVIDALKEGVKYTKLSNGKFNIISGSIVDVWDERFTSYDATIRNVDPTNEEIEIAMNCVANVNDIDNILVIDDVNNTVKFNSFASCGDKASITLGAMAKSYFLDKMATIDEFKNVGASIYDAGQSSIIIRGENPTRDGGVWNIAVNDSLNSNSFTSSQAAQLQLQGNNAISTSGIQHRGYINSEGIIRHHIIDATSGYPNTYLLGATVIGESAMIADIATTTLMTMNSLEEIKAYLELLETNQIILDVLLQVNAGDSIKLLVNSSMNNQVAQVFNEIDLEVFNYGA